MNIAIHLCMLDFLKQEDELIVSVGGGMATHKPPYLGFCELNFWVESRHQPRFFEMLLF